MATTKRTTKRTTKAAVFCGNSDPNHKGVTCSRPTGHKGQHGAFQNRWGSRGPYKPRRRVIAPEDACGNCAAVLDGDSYDGLCGKCLLPLDCDPSDEDGPPEGVDLSLPGEAEYDEAMRRDREIAEELARPFPGTPEQARELLDWIFSEEAQGVRLDDAEHLHVFVPGEVGPMAAARCDDAGRWEVR